MGGFLSGMAGAGIFDAAGAFFGSRAKKKQTKNMIRDYNAAETNSLADLGGARDASIGYQQPFYQGGVNAFSRASQMTQPGFQFSPADPSYAWRVAEDQRAIEGSASARGGLHSGGTLKALQDRRQALASTEYGNEFARNFQLAGLGANAADQMQGAQQNYGNNAFRARFAAADGRTGARELRGKAIADQWGAGADLAGAVAGFFGV